MDLIEQAIRMGWAVEVCYLGIVRHKDSKILKNRVLISTVSSDCKSGVFWDRCARRRLLSTHHSRWHRERTPKGRLN